MRKVLSILGGALLALSLPTVASAANGYATGNVNMRTGPGTQYTVITTLPAGAPIVVNACSSWCDVIWGGTRGWVSRSYVAYGAYSAPVYVQPAPVYVAPPVVYEAAPVRYAPAPWSPDWYAYCARRYRTFDAQSGTFIRADGREYFCR